MARVTKVQVPPDGPGPMRVVGMPGDPAMKAGDRVALPTFRPDEEVARVDVTLKTRPQPPSYVIEVNELELRTLHAVLGGRTVRDDRTILRLYDTMNTAITGDDIGAGPSKYFTYPPGSIVPVAPRSVPVVGSLVRLVTAPTEFGDENRDLAPGMDGRVVALEPLSGRIGVEWGKLIAGGHTCRGAAPHGRGWWLQPHHLKVLA